MSWYSAPRLGLLGQELDILCKVLDINVSEDNVQVDQRNLLGASMKSYLRQNVPSVTMTLSMIPDSIMSILRGLQSALAPLNFIYNGSLAVKYLMGTSASATSIVIPPTSCNGVTITGVFLQSDTLQSGTDYYSAGSTFDATTGTITLATALPGANTDVFINYTFSGMKCFIKIAVNPHSGFYKNYWQGTLTLTGA